MATEIHQGILRVWNSGTYTADVQLAGSLWLHLRAVPVARNIASAEMVAGRKVAVALFDPTNPDDAVLFAVWT
jgi:hypothetical protein